MPAMVSQSQDWCEGSPSRSGSVMSLDSSRQAQRPSSAKTPPSYYDAVRSRHSLSQPLNKPKQQQQLKYNSLPRPLPQRVPPTNGQGPVRAPWPDDQPKTYPELPRLLYDSPPKPANHVPLQIHQDKDGPRLSRPGQEKLSDNCAPRGNGEQLRKDMYRNIPLRSDVRPPPPVPGVRAPLPRSPENSSRKTNSLPRREILPSTDSLRRGYSINTNGNLHSPYSTTASRAAMDGPINYEPRYSKSGKLCPRPLSQNAYEPRSLPAPAVQLRTGPLGSYPDAETLKKSEMARQLEKSYSPDSGVDYDRKQQRLVPQRNDMSQQIFVETNSYVNGHPAVADHLAIPYQIPQLSPKNSRSSFEGKKMCNGKDTMPPRIQPQLKSNSANNVAPYGNNQLLNCRRAGSDAHNLHLESRNRRQQEAALIPPKENGHTYANHAYNNSQKRASPSESRSDLSGGDNDVIYANHQMSVHSRSLHKVEPQRPGIQRTPPRNNMYNYEKQQGPVPGSRNGYRDPQECAQNGSLTYENQPNYNFTYAQHGDQKPSYESSRPEKRLPPPVSQKPHPSLPQPSQMIMVTETRNWNGQAISYSKDMSKPVGWNGQDNPPHSKDFPKISDSNSWNVQNNAHSKDFSKSSEPNAWNGQNSSSLVKPTPRMSRVASTTAYQPSNNEQQFYRSGSPNPSIRSGYESSSTSSIRDYARKPSKSDSAAEQNGSYGSSSKLRGEQCFLSASMSSLCSDTSSLSSRRRHEDSGHVINAWKMMNEELKNRKDKGSVFSASPWEREEKEKMQREQLSESRRLRDREIAFLESLESRTEKQEEWLRILRLEREFQRRAEQEDDDDDEEEEEEETSVCSEGSSKADSEKTKDFHGDKLTVIPNERLGLKLLDDLIETTNSSSSSSAEAKCEHSSFNKATSEKHFIPLELTIPDRDLHQPSSLPNLHTGGGNNILQVFEHNQDHNSNSNRASKPPIPAPRPSKAFTPIVLSETSPMESMLESRNGDTSSLTKLEISDSSAFFCASDHDRNEDLPQDNWLIEVNSFDVPQTPKHQQNGDSIKEESRIYENIKPYDLPSSKSGNPDYSRNPEFGCHTLPKSTSQSMTSREQQRSNYHEKKFPTMGISSTLSRKVNGLTEADILPTLYATSKVRNVYSTREQIPSDLEDKSPEFKKLWISRPEKLTFQDKIRKFSIQAGENDLPRDKVKNSRAQRELEIKFNDRQKRAAALSES